MKIVSGMQGTRNQEMGSENKDRKKKRKKKKKEEKTKPKQNPKKHQKIDHIQKKKRVITKDKGKHTS